ncbi:MAG: ABC transporter permease, partial [Vicinamibacterales bacterium]
MRWLVPSPWRDTVQRDIEDEARASRRGPWWSIGQLALVAFRLRLVVSGDAFVSDVRYALKTGWRSKAFAVGAILTFALGVGVNVAVFSAVDRMMIRSLPYGDPDRLVVMGAYSSDGIGPYGTVQGAQVTAVREQHQGITDLAVVGQAIHHASSVDGAQTLLFAQASYNVVDVLGVRMHLGRPFTREDATSRRPAILLTYEAWHSRFGAGTDVVGARVWTDRKPAEVIGVLPRGFFVPANNWVGRADGFVLDPEALVVAYGPKARETPPFVRLKPGVSVGAAEQQMRAITAGVGEWMPATVSLRLAPLREAMFGGYATYTWLVIVASALVLLMCCANLASLMFVRARSREHQVALTMALGASRARVIRLAVIESLMLASAGTIVALGVLAWTRRALQGLLPEIFRRYAASTFEPRVLTFALIATVACALIAGIWPVARTTSANAAAVMQRGGGRHASGSRRGGALVLAIEAFIAALLVSGAGLTARSLMGLLRTDLGFAPDGLHTLSLQLPTPLPAPADRYRILMAALQVVRDTPGLESVGAAEYLPFENVRSEGFLPGQRDSQSWRVMPGYFAAMGVPLIAGRELAPGDESPGVTAAVISEMGLSRV